MPWSIDLSAVQKPSVSSGFPDSFAPSVTKSPEVFFCFWLQKRLSLGSWEGVRFAVKNFDLCVCVCLCWLQWFASVKWKELPGWWKHAVCSRPDLQNGWGHRMRFSSVDLSSDLASLCLERHGNPSWNGQASYWMGEDLGLSPKLVWIGWKRLVAKVRGGREGLLGWGRYKANGPCCHQLFFL